MVMHRGAEICAASAMGVLRWFGQKQGEAKKAYGIWQLFAEGIDQGRRPELVGGGLIRSLGGWSAVKAMRLLVPIYQNRIMFAEDLSNKIFSLFCNY